MLRLATVVVLALVQPATPCGNAVRLDGDAATAAIVAAETALSNGDYNKAWSATMGVAFTDERLGARALDVQLLVNLRLTPLRVAKTAVDHFSRRVRRDPKNVKYRAWIAEAYAAAGEKRAALQILRELEARDLIPDGFAYVALAKVTGGETRERAFAMCHARSKLAICQRHSASTRKPASVTLLSETKRR